MLSLCPDLALSNKVCCPSLCPNFALSNKVCCLYGDGIATVSERATRAFGGKQNVTFLPV